MRTLSRSRSTTSSAPAAREPLTPGETSPASRGHRTLARARRWTVRVLAGIGLIAIVGTGLGAARDISQFDRTTGGYDPPYTGWTGTPVDWTTTAQTSTGFYKAGDVIDFEVNCTTGMVTFHALGMTYHWRPLSPRAIAVHRPREACTTAGFTPTF
jgi:hypothetical protein